MSHDDHSETPQGDAFSSRIETLATAIEERPPVDVEEAPETRSSRHIYWLIGGLCALTIGVAEIGVLARGESAGAPPPPAEVVAKYENAPCATRMAEIMKAVSAYTDSHGGPPPNLTVLTPDYLASPAIDPASNQPYGYQVSGEEVSVSCPSAALQPAARAGT